MKQYADIARLFGAFVRKICLLKRIRFRLLLANGSGICTLALGTIGMLFYVYSVVLSVLTLKTEKKAQSRAYEILHQDYHVTGEELSSLKELFRLYNVQYVNDIILSSLELLYTILEIVIAIKGNVDN